MWVFPDTSVIDYGYADMDTLFSLGPYVFIFLMPAITMRSFAEEKKMGTMEFLLTKPVTEWGIVLGKFIAGLSLMLVSVLPTVVYYYSVYLLGEPVGNIDASGVMGSYIGILLLGTVFCSIGIFASSITPNQIVSFVTAAFLCLIIYSGIDSLSTLVSDGAIALQIKRLGILYHYDSMSRGLIDSRDILYFISVTGLMLLLTKTVLSSRRW
jgi:ABC-2 type transport system permease protein